MRYPLELAALGTSRFSGSQADNEARDNIARYCMPSFREAHFI